MGKYWDQIFYSISELLQICLDKKAVQVSSTLQVIYF